MIFGEISRDGACMVDFNIEDYEQHPYKFIIDDFVEAKELSST